MKIDIVGPEGVDALDGAVVVIDVLRAFTTAAYAFAGGAAEIVLVETIDDARALRVRWPDAVLVGEDGGYPVPGFDLCNSPFEVTQRRFDGARLIQRTTAGTRSVVRSRRAADILAASLVCGAATARHLLATKPTHVDLVLSGRDRPVGGTDDLACADFIAAHLRGERPGSDEFVRRVRESDAARRFLDPAQTDFRLQDLELALEVDRFDFAMAVRRRDDLFVLEKVAAPA